MLKPGRWMTVEFSNTKASVWNNIKSALIDSELLISNVIDKSREFVVLNSNEVICEKDLSNIFQY